MNARCTELTRQIQQSLTQRRNADVQPRAAYEEYETGKVFRKFCGICLAGVHGLEPWALGFGDRCSTN
jgi:hypothetical protein